MPTPLFSILMPTYNHEGFVRAAVDSVLAQNCADFELLAIDDASVDATWEQLQSVRDPRLVCRRHATNMGAHATLNEALGLARGKYIAIINSDDVYAESRLARIRDCLAERGDGPAWGFSDIRFIDGSGKDAEHYDQARSHRSLAMACGTELSSISLLRGNMVVTTSNLFFVSEMIRRVGGFRPLRYTHDWDWALRASRETAPVWIREPLLSYRVHGANTLAEGDRWRHIQENSFIQADAIQALGRRDADTALRACEAVLQNESFHPTPLALFLTLLAVDSSTDPLSRLAREDAGEWLLKRLATSAELPMEAFDSLPWQLKRNEDQVAMIDDRWQTIQKMAEDVAARDQVIADSSAVIRARDECVAAQAAMLEERWAAMQQMGQEIDQRDKRIVALEHELARINAHPAVRLARWARRMLPGAH